MGRAAGTPVTVIRLPKGERPAAQSPVAGGWTVVLMASIRAWKGTANVSPLCLEVVEELRRRAEEVRQRLTVVWMTPASGGLLSSSRGTSAGPDVHVPGTGPDVERALGEILFGARS
jgi:hypothetical protein